MKATNVRLLAAVPIALAVGLGVTGFFLWRQVEPLFQSTAVVRVVRDATDLEQLGSLAPGGEDTKVFLENEAQAIASDAVLQNVATNLNLATVWGERQTVGVTLTSGEVTLLLRERVQATPESADSLLRIHAASPERDHAQQLANAVAAAYCEYRVERRRRIIQDAIDVLARPYQENREKVRRATEQLEQARQALDETVRHQSPPPRPDFKQADMLRGRLNRLTMAYMTQSNQVAQLQTIEPELLAKMQTRLARTQAELTDAAAAVQVEVGKQEALRAYWLAHEELEKAKKVFAPIQQTVEAGQRNLAATENPPARVEEAATEAISIPTPLPPAALGCLAGAGVLLLLGIATMRSARPARNGG